MTQEQPTLRMPAPTIMPVGEIEFGDGTKLLVPQPVRFTELRPSSPLDDFYITLPGLPSSAEVEAYAEKHPHSNALQRTDPLWVRLCLLLGALLLVAAGLALIALGIAIDVLGPEFWR